MSFKIYRQDLKVTGEDLVIFKFGVQSLKVAEGIVMIACLKHSELFYRTTVFILFFCLFFFFSKLNTPTQSNLIMYRVIESQEILPTSYT